MEISDPPARGGQGVSPDFSATSPDRVPELDGFAERIRARDRTAHIYWLHNGVDLNSVKHRLLHGAFEAWCERELNYSKSKAEKLMRAADIFGGMLESGIVTDLPPPTLAYALSARSLPDTIRNEFVPRLIAADKTAAAECKAAIAAHRESAKKAKRRAALSPEQQAAVDKREAAKANRDAREQQQREAERMGQAAARSAAVDLIVARVGDGLPELLRLITEAGPSGIFSYLGQRELEARAQAQVIQPEVKSAHSQPCPKPVASIPSTATPAGIRKSTDLGSLLKDYEDVRLRGGPASGQKQREPSKLSKPPSPPPQIQH